MNEVQMLGWEEEEKVITFPAFIQELEKRVAEDPDEDR